LLIVAPPNRPEYLIIAWAIGGIQTGGMGWSTMIVEMVPADQRGRWGGISQFFNGIAMIPASILGGLLWTTLNPELPFIVFIIVDLLISMPLLASIPETLKYAD
jgi:MFS family permease